MARDIPPLKVAVYRALTKEALDDAVLLWRVRCDELLMQSVVPAGCTESAALEDKPIITSDDWGAPFGSKCAESSDVCLFDGTLSFLGSTAQRKLPADELTVMTVNHRHQVCPSVCAGGHMCHIHGPSAIAVCRPVHRAVYPRPRGARPLMHQPSPSLQNAVNPFPIDPYSQAITQQRPQSAVPIGWVFLDQQLQLRFKLSRIPWYTLCGYSLHRGHAGAADLKHPGRSA